MRRFHPFWAGFTLLSLLSTTCAAEPPRQAWFPQATPLPPPDGPVIQVADVEQLFQAARDVEPGGTILLADGHYMLPRYFELHTDRVTMRSASGDRDRVVLDGTRSQDGELVGISNCSGVTVADLTIQNIKWNGFKINSNLRATHVTIRNCVIHNIWQRGVKGPAVDPRDRGRFWPTACRIEYCLFYNDRPKQFSDDPTDTPDTFGGNYIGGIDAMHARQWVIRDNVMVAIRGRTGEGRGAIFLWNESVDCLVERNVIIDCDCGICLGNHYRHDDTRWHGHGCVVRNNFVTRCSETGILAAHTRDCLVIHNTVHDPASRLRRLIWVQDDNDGLLVANNLLSGPNILNTGTGQVAMRGNVAVEDLTATFVDSAAGNLRLRRSVSSLAERLEQASHDMDGRQRPRNPTAGAIEWAMSRNETEPPLPPRQDDTTRQPRTEPSWVEAMKKVHAGFQGREGYVAQLGDSITYSMAFWSPLGWDDPDAYLTEDDGLPKTPPNSRWRDVLRGTRDKGPDFGNYSGWRVGQLIEAADAVLQREKPEIAMIMIGTNDISAQNVPEDYARQLAEVIDKCLAVCCVPILSTIPPRRGHENSVDQANRIVRDLAARKQIPLVDFHAECLRRRPGNSWDGTIISDDGVHPSGGETHVYSEENLQKCGYALRNWIQFLAVRQVYFRVLHPADERREGND